MCQFLSDASSGDAINVGGDEIDRLALALDLPDASREVTAKAEMRDDTITGYDHLLNLTEKWSSWPAKQGFQSVTSILSASVAGSEVTSGCTEHV